MLRSFFLYISSSGLQPACLYSPPYVIPCSLGVLNYVFGCRAIRYAASTSCVFADFSSPSIKEPNQSRARRAAEGGGGRRVAPCEDFYSAIVAVIGKLGIKNVGRMELEHWGKLWLLSTESVTSCMWIRLRKCIFFRRRISHTSQFPSNRHGITSFLSSRTLHVVR